MTRRGWMRTGTALALIVIVLAVAIWALRRNAMLWLGAGENAAAAEYAELDASLGVALERDAERPDIVLLATGCGFTSTSPGEAVVFSRFGAVDPTCYPAGFYFYNPLTTSVWPESRAMMR